MKHCGTIGEFLDGAAAVVIFGWQSATKFHSFYTFEHQIKNTLVFVFFQF